MVRCGFGGWAIPFGQAPPVNVVLDVPGCWIFPGGFRAAGLADQAPDISTGILSPWRGTLQHQTLPFPRGRRCWDRPGRFDCCAQLAAFALATRVALACNRLYGCRAFSSSVCGRLISLGGLSHSVLVSLRFADPGRIDVRQLDNAAIGQWC